MKEVSKNKKLEIIPKLEKYIQYMLDVILKLPRTEKFSIGNEYKTSMYKTLSYVMYLNKIEDSKCLYYTNIIDAEINVQRIYLRIMQKNRWIDNKKFEVAMGQIYELGKILGGLINIMAKTIRNEYDKALTYENLMKAHFQSRKGKRIQKRNNPI